MERLGLDGEYVAKDADQALLATTVAELRDGLIDGMNITMPLKEAAWRLCDRVDEDAGAAGSVNTLRSRGSAVEGISTDIAAAAEILAREEFNGAPLLILGAGGAAAAIARAGRNRQVHVSARDLQRARGIEGGAGSFVPFGTGVADAVVFNATPLGMHGEPLPQPVLDGARGLVDLAYGTQPTPGVAAAVAGGIPVVDGLEFLALQAAHSFEWWTGVPAPLDTMLLAAKND